MKRDRKTATILYEVGPSFKQIVIGNKRRERVVELLRCAADVCSLTKADVVPKQGTLGWAAWEAKRSVQGSLPPARRRAVEFNFGEPYRWLLLEAAMRVEEGALP